jgi:hypothetical protein
VFERETGEIDRLLRLRLQVERVITFRAAGYGLRSAYGTDQVSDNGLPHTYDRPRDLNGAPGLHGGLTTACFFSRGSFVE